MWFSMFSNFGLQGTQEIQTRMVPTPRSCTNSWPPEGRLRIFWYILGVKRYKSPQLYFKKHGKSYNMLLRCTKIVRGTHHFWRYLEGLGRLQYHEMLKMGDHDRQILKQAVLEITFLGSLKVTPPNKNAIPPKEKGHLNRETGCSPWDFGVIWGTALLLEAWHQTPIHWWPKIGSIYPLVMTNIAMV